MERLARWVWRYPKAVVGFYLVVTVLLSVQFPRLTIDPSVDVFVPRDHPEVRFFDEIRQVFGLLNFVIIGVVEERDGGIYRPDTLALVRDLTASLREIPDVTKVLSLFSFPYIEGDAEGMRVTDLLQEVPQGEEALMRLRERIGRWPLLTGALVSGDGKATALLVRYRRNSDAELRRRVFHAVADRVRPFEKGPPQIFVAGMTAIEVSISDAIRQDMKRLFPLVVAVVVLCLWLSFRRAVGVLLPLLTVVVAVLWTMGAMAVLRVPLNTLTGALPVLLMAVGTAYTIHLLFHFLYHVSRGQKPEDAAVQAVTRIGSAVLMAGLTTIGGFASLGVSQVVPIRSFGLFSAFGTAVALGASLTLIPALLRLGLKRIRTHREPSSRETRSALPGLDRILSNYTAWVLRHRRLVYAAAIGLAVFFLAGAFRIYPESDYITHFKRSSYIRQSDEKINRYFDGSSFLDIIVDTGEPDGVKDPDILRRMESLQAFAATRPKVGGTMSLVDYLKRMNQVLNEESPEAYRLPDTREMVAQYLLLYSMSGDESDLEDVVDPQYRRACISVRLKTGSTRHAARIIDEIERYNREVTKLPMHMTASMVLGKVVDDLTIRGQIESLMASVPVVFLLVSWVFRSFVGGLFAVLPLLLCTALNFGILGWAGIPLQIGTALIASVALGIGIDYAIHYLNIARIQAPGAADLGASLRESARTGGRAILYNAMAVGFGFFVLILSSFIADIYFGAFISLTMFTASLATLTLLPCLIHTFRPRFLRLSCKQKPDGAS